MYLGINVCVCVFFLNQRNGSTWSSLLKGTHIQTHTHIIIYIYSKTIQTKHNTNFRIISRSQIITQTQKLQADKFKRNVKQKEIFFKRLKNIENSNRFYQNQFCCCKDFQNFPNEIKIYEPFSFVGHILKCILVWRFFRFCLLLLFFFLGCFWFMSWSQWFFFDNLNSERSIFDVFW